MRIKKFILSLVFLSLSMQFSVQALPFVYRWMLLVSGLGISNKVIKEYKFRNDPYYAQAKKKRRMYNLCSFLVEVVIDEQNLSPEQRKLKKMRQKGLRKNIRAKTNNAADLIAVPGKCREAAQLYHEATEELEGFFGNNPSIWEQVKLYFDEK